MALAVSPRQLSRTGDGASCDNDRGSLKDMPVLYPARTGRGFFPPGSGSPADGCLWLNSCPIRLFAVVQLQKRPRRLIACISVRRRCPPHLAGMLKSTYVARRRRMSSGRGGEGELRVDATGTAGMRKKKTTRGNINRYKCFYCLIMTGTFRGKRQLLFRELLLPRLLLFGGWRPILKCAHLQYPLSMLY